MFWQLHFLLLTLWLSVMNFVNQITLKFKHTDPKRSRGLILHFRVYLYPVTCISMCGWQKTCILRNKKYSHSLTEFKLHHTNITLRSFICKICQIKIKITTSNVTNVLNTIKTLFLNFYNILNWWAGNRTTYACNVLYTHLKQYHKLLYRSCRP